MPMHAAPTRCSPSRSAVHPFLAMRRRARRYAAVSPGGSGMLALARYDLLLAPLMRRRTWAVAPRRFFLWAGMVLLGGILVGLLFPRATTVYQSLGFGCLVLLLPFMQIVRGWIGDR